MGMHPGKRSAAFLRSLARKLRFAFRVNWGLGQKGQAGLNDKTYACNSRARAHNALLESPLMMAHKAAPLAVALAGALGVLLCIPCFFSPLFDDAYIHARIAEQLLASGSAGFNPGTALKTDSATGYLLLLSGLSWLAGDAISALRAIQGLSVLLYVSCLFRLAVVLNGRLTALHSALIGALARA